MGDPGIRVCAGGHRSNVIAMSFGVAIKDKIATFLIFLGYYPDMAREPLLRLRHHLFVSRS